MAESIVGGLFRETGARSSKVKNEALNNYFRGCDLDAAP